MSIKIKVAFCKECSGYNSATPLQKKHCQHPEIIDHYFYHGEPYFTLDDNTFKDYTQDERIEIKILTISEHIKTDHLHCNCLQKTSALKTFEILENYEIETDFYFKDLYKFYNIHPINSNALNDLELLPTAS